ncbi:MAG: hypothetical protein EPO12_17245 [Aquabacterium sp.]|jgi:hypothetical protein|nr:MAG: hypothetical protein EPO12_17245 [Aquabacterium sp.]
MHTQRGFSTVMVIGIIVLMASLCAFALRFVAAAQSTASIDLLSARAQQAAEAGLEWQRMQIQQNPAPCPAAIVTNLVVPFSTGNFSVRVTCTPQGSLTDGTPISMFSLSAVACYPSAGGVCPNAAAMPGEYVERQLTGIATKP